MKECIFYTGEIKNNCKVILNIFGLNTNCQDNKSCPFKQNQILKYCLLDIYNYKLSKRDINKRIEQCFSTIQELQKLVKKKLRVVK